MLCVHIFLQTVSIKVSVVKWSAVNTLYIKCEYIYQVLFKSGLWSMSNVDFNPRARIFYLLLQTLKAMNHRLCISSSCPDGNQ